MTQCACGEDHDETGLGEELDVSTALVATSVSPIPGVMRMADGTDVAKVFVTISALDKDNTETEHTYIFDPMSTVRVGSALTEMSVDYVEKVYVAAMTDTSPVPAVTGRPQPSAYL